MNRRNNPIRVLPKDIYQQKIKQFYMFINENWSEENYKTCIQDWERVKQYIVYSKINLNDRKVCRSCGLLWMNEKFLDHEYEIDGYIIDICCNCDQFISPFLSNPLNHKYVYQYVQKKYHKYIFSDLYNSYKNGCLQGKEDGIYNGIRDTIYRFTPKLCLTVPLTADYTNREAYEEGYKNMYNLYYRQTFRKNDDYLEELKQYFDYVILKAPVSSEDEDFSDEWCMI